MSRQPELVRLAMPAAAAALLGLSTAACLLADEQPYGRFQFDEAEREHWAFIPVKRPEIPEVRRDDWVQNPIDAFVLAGLEEAGFEPAPPADPRTLLRRASLDLTGLPPTPDQQQAFLADSSTEAWSRVVDDLLSRPAYGERWARHWLDVVRYAESNGYERDGAKPSVWRYRDYVINAFNQDKPYDRFVTEQLAGDEMEGSTAEMQIATTFLRLGPWDDEPADPEIDRYDQLDDLVGATTATFLAQTVRCARCHDHKFESFKQRDYTRLLAVFEPLKRPQDGRTDLDRIVGTADELAAYRQAVEQADALAADLRRQFDESEWNVAQRLAAAGVLVSAPADSTPDAGQAAMGEQPDEAWPADALAAFATAPSERTDAQQELVKKYRSKLRGVIEAQGTAEEKSGLEELRRQIEDADASRPPEPAKAYIWYEESPQAPPAHVFQRGDPRQPLDEVGPGVPAILVDAPLPPPTPAADSSGRRRQLAEWLTRPDNPLTARVMVNRIWQHHFSDGLVGSENDFGIMGQPPTHPELLDWLAAEFVERGWSIKQMHRLMLLSNTYRQSWTPNDAAQKRDPENDLLWRWSPRRGEAEVLRDSILATSGRLNRQAGGPSIYPEISEAVMASQSRPGNGWSKSEPDQAARRSIYVFVKRTLLLPEFEVLDFPDTNGTCEQRQVSTVAPQALTFLNGQFMYEQARHFAGRLEQEAADDAARVERAFLLALSRPPTESERASVLEFLAQQQQQIQSDAQTAGQTADGARRQALEAFCLVLFNTNEFAYMR